MPLSKSSKKKEKQEWNLDSVWTADSDDEPDYMSPPLRTKAHSTFYEEALVRNSTMDMRESDVTLANLELIQAVRNGDHKNVAKALSKDADPDSTTEESSDVFTMAHIAAKDGHSISLSTLISNGANFRTKTLHGWEPLHLAAYHGKQDCIRILLTATADIDALNKYGQTPLMMAVGEDHKDCARLLLQHGADETIKTQKGKLALDLCKSKKMKMILKSKGDPESLTGKPHLEHIKSQLEQIGLHLESEGLRYSKLEAENEELRKELEMTRLERDAVNKSLNAILEERDTIQNENQRVTSEWNKVAKEARVEKEHREHLETRNLELEAEVLKLEENVNTLIEEHTVERDTSAKKLAMLSTQFQQIMTEAKTEGETDSEKLRKIHDDTEKRKLRRSNTVSSLQSTESKTSS